MTFCAYVNDLPNDYKENKNSDIIIKRVLRFGSRGDDVKELQKLLKINADGIFGNLTMDKVMNFQKENGLFVDGIVGPKTLLKLIK
jgi:peptidoglycan hydrolase-like protein with peptidoglycan-binding domain